MKSFFVIDEEKAEDVAAWIKDGRIETVPKIARGTEKIYVAGGDGTLLGAIRKYWRYNLPFFGINRGTRGFLLNPIKTFGQYEWASRNYYTIALNLLEATFFLKNGRKAEVIAFNDVYFNNLETKSSCWGLVNCRGDFKRRFSGDGLIVATPQGSTAYNRSAGGHILSLRDHVLAVTTIVASNGKPIFEVTRAKKIEIEFSRGRMAGTADNKTIKNVERAVIGPSRHTVKLCFMDGYDFQLMRYKR